MEYLLNELMNGLDVSGNDTMITTSTTGEQMTYAEHIQKLQKLISSLETAQTSAAYWGLTAAAMSINDARDQLTKDMCSLRSYADEHMAHGQEIA